MPTIELLIVLVNSVVHSAKIKRFKAACFALQTFDKIGLFEP